MFISGHWRSRQETNHSQVVSSSILAVSPGVRLSPGFVIARGVFDGHGRALPGPERSPACLQHFGATAAASEDFLGRRAGKVGHVGAAKDGAFGAANFDVVVGSHNKVSVCGNRQRGFGRLTDSFQSCSFSCCSTAGKRRPMACRQPFGLSRRPKLIRLGVATGMKPLLRRGKSSFLRWRK